EEIKKQITVDDLEKFIPLIASHWEDLEKLFGESLIQILKNAIDRIDIKPSELGTNQSDEPFSYIMGKALEETTELIFENKELKISLLRRYYTLSDEEKKVLGKDGFFGIRHNYDELPTDVIQRLTFVFYLELLRIHKDVLPVIKLAMDVWKIHNKTPTEVLAKEDHQARMTRMKNSADWMCIFNRKVIKASKKVIDIVRNDIELSNLLKGNLDEILPNLSNFKSVNYIREIIE
ncbi:MAG: hypothetical protein HY295_05845, partial [Thaumarchaeota archaeon]|nr:hypothetical protein [Nitrososphaerota archaeon]